MKPIPSPFPYFGGKRKVADQVWQRFGKVQNYVEPFAGSAAALFARPLPFSGNETINDVDGMVCLQEDSRLMRFDLGWVRAGEVNVGDELLGFDENNGAARSGLRAPVSYRRLRKSTVTGTRIVRKPCYRLTFDDGTIVVCSEDHQWLGGSHKPGNAGGRGWRWLTTKNLVCDRESQRSWIMKLCDVSAARTDYGTGWLAGFFDGEGNLTSGPGWRISITQKQGPEADKCLALLQTAGFRCAAKERDRGNPRHSSMLDITILGGMKESLRFLQVVRPERLIANLQRGIGDRSLYGRDHHAVGLVEKECLGDVDVVAIETDTHTFIAEGLASHNCNFWRAVKLRPEKTAEHADNPVNENDLHARHAWLVGQKEALSARLEGDPEWCDPKVAGWWVWGMSCWIGSGFCSGRGPWGVVDGQLVHLGDNGQGVNRQLVHLGNNGQGVNRQLVHLGNNGQERKRPALAIGGGLGVVSESSVDGISRQMPSTNLSHVAARTQNVNNWFNAIADRLTRVRVCSGDWSRVCGPSVTFKHGLTAVFLDPPYADTADRQRDLYTHDDESVAHDVREWAIENGKRADMRIALCGYEGEHEMPKGWEKLNWNAGEGFGGQAEERSGNGKRERVWFSPACLGARQGDLLASLGKGA